MPFVLSRDRARCGYEKVRPVQPSAAPCGANALETRGKFSFLKALAKTTAALLPDILRLRRTFRHRLRRSRSTFWLKGGTRCPQRVGKQLARSGAPRTRQKQFQSAALKPTQAKNSEQTARHRGGLGKDIATYLDVIQFELEIGAIGLSPRK